MTHTLSLNWATMALSLFNAIVLLWLGATVLLNADRRTWGIWLAGFGLLLGGAFFISHSAILGLDLSQLSRSLHFWWYLGLIPAVVLPLGWYVVILWYAGFWNDPDSRLYRRQRRWLGGVVAVALVGLLAVVIYANPLPLQFSLLPLKFIIQRTGGTSLMVAGYAAYLLLCFGLTLDALLRPGPTERAMGDLARRRARGWLIAASLLLSAVSILVIGGLLWVLLGVRQDGLYVITEPVLLTLAQLDLVVSGLIAAANLAMGQAIVAYEIFTGKTLPRSGLRRQWQLALVLAASYGLLVGGILSLQQRPVYSALLSALFMTAFFALLSWRSYAERERYIEHLRPFVSSQHLYDHLLTAPPLASSQPSATDLDAMQPFQTLCRDVLGARLAFLAPLGSLAPLAGAPLVYPLQQTVSLPPLHELATRFTSPRTIYAEVAPKKFGGAVWAVPLWSARGLVGMLLLGEKEDGGVYTQEEMEIARASCERLVDTRASAEMARRLLALQRQRLAESQVADRRTRRILHDDVLPQVHAALLALNQGTEADGDVRALLTDVHHQISNLLRDIPPVVTPEVARLGALGALRRALAQEFTDSFDEVTWDVPPQLLEDTRSLAPLEAEVLFYAAREALRNAARHGRGSGDRRQLWVQIRACLAGEGLVLEIEDNGVGLDVDSGGNANGRGLALHSTMMAVVGGTLALDSAPGDYTRVRLELPSGVLVTDRRA